MSKPRVVPAKITNELAGASAFFKPNATPIPEAVPEPSSAVTAPNVTPTPNEPRTPVRPERVVKRHMIRHPFELYMDQIERLREAAQTDRQQGGAGSMSKMVREAIDRYLDQLPHNE
jgi:hypothetical protein